MLVLKGFSERYLSRVATVKVEFYYEKSYRDQEDAGLMPGLEGYLVGKGFKRVDNHYGDGGDAFFTRL